MVTLLSGAQISPSGDPGPGSFPAGSVIDYAGSAAPIGWLFCYGQSLLRAGTYANLFAAVGTSFGAVDGTHFNVPDLREMAIAGKGNMGGTERNTYLVITKTGDTATDGYLRNLSGGFNPLTLGMVVTGPGIQANTRLQNWYPNYGANLVPTAVALNLSTTATATGVSLKFFQLDANALGASGGRQGESFQWMEMPQHAHSAPMYGSGTGVAGGAAFGFPSIYTNNEGSGMAHANVQPTAILNKIIRY